MLASTIFQIVGSTKVNAFALLHLNYCRSQLRLFYFFFKLFQAFFNQLVVSSTLTMFYQIIFFPCCCCCDRCSSLTTLCNIVAFLFAFN